MSETSAESDEPASAAALDEAEQHARLANLKADTALKLQALNVAKAQIFLGLITVLVALGGLIIGAMTLYFDRHPPPEPHNTFIFLIPDHNIVL
jgi:hypothetical protein